MLSPTNNGLQYTAETIQLSTSINEFLLTTTNFNADEKVIRKNRTTDLMKKKVVIYQIYFGNQEYFFVQLVAQSLLIETLQQQPICFQVFCNHQKSFLTP